VTWPDEDELAAAPEAVEPLAGVVALLELPELHAAASNPAAASTAVPARRLLSLMALLGGIGFYWPCVRSGKVAPASFCQTEPLGNS
jgi:hypothetical protein